MKIQKLMIRLNLFSFNLIYLRAKSPPDTNDISLVTTSPLYSVLSAPNLLVIVLFIWVLPESPRWLISRNKKEKVLRILDHAAKVNRHHLPIDRILEADKKDEKLASDSDLKTATILDLFWPPTILVR